MKAAPSEYIVSYHTDTSGAVVVAGMNLNSVSKHLLTEVAPAVLSDVIDRP